MKPCAQAGSKNPGQDPGLPVWPKKGGRDQSDAQHAEYIAKIPEHRLSQCTATRLSPLPANPLINPALSPCKQDGDKDHSSAYQDIVIWLIAAPFYWQAQAMENRAKQNQNCAGNTSGPPVWLKKTVAIKATPNMPNILPKYQSMTLGTHRIQNLSHYNLDPAHLQHHFSGKHSQAQGMTGPFCPHPICQLYIDRHKNVLPLPGLPRLIRSDWRRQLQA